MTDPDCKECDGDGFIELQIAVDDFKKIACECNQYDGSDEDYDRWKDSQND